MPRPTVWTRLVALFLLWSGLRAGWFLLLASITPLLMWWRREEFPDFE